MRAWGCIEYEDILNMRTWGYIEYVDMRIYLTNECEDILNIRTWGYIYRIKDITEPVAGSKTGPRQLMTWVTPLNKSAVKVTSFDTSTSTSQ